MPIVVATEPGVEPISATEAKLHCRVDHSAEDDLIAIYTKAARRKVEADTGRRLINTVVDEYRDRFPCVDTWIVGAAPLVSVSSIKAIEESGTEHALSSSDYVIDTASDRPRVTLKSTASWPDSGYTLKPINGAVARFTIGYGTAGSDVPAQLREAMLLLIAAWYANREFAGDYNSTPVIMTPNGYRELIADFQNYVFG